MKLSELLASLNELKNKHGDINVRIQADHGQELMNSTWVGVSYINEDTCMPSTSDEIDDICNIPVIEIQAF